MGTVTVLTESSAEVAGDVVDGRVAIDASALTDAIGWQLKPEGLCQADVCVPVPDQAALMLGDRIDVAAAAAAVGRSSLVDAEHAAIAVSQPATARDTVVNGMQAPNLVLPDLDGNEVAMAEFRGRKKLLVVFASW
ncbi:MAG: hypothetical protein HKN26_09635 [Acidimicrobiales bacterium]|nr:hypothetical protein [Acidimicrobiales bacterium]